MNYRMLGTTCIPLSVLGLGAMRLPGFEFSSGKYLHEKEEEAIKIAHRAFELGVNIIDTAYIYANGNNEVLVGKILKSWKEKVYLSTKSPIWLINKTGDFRRYLEEQLKRLDRDYIDIYYLHGLDDEIWENTILKYSIDKEALRAKEEGLIRNIGFSSHDKKLKKLIDTGLFECILVQYNILDRASEPDIIYASEKGLGVSVMGPVAGGRLSWPSEILNNYLKGNDNITASTAQIALRFVMGNANVTCALSGMISTEMVEENVKLASMDKYLDESIWDKINVMTEKTKHLKDLYCTGCNYCRPCPKGINIPYIFQQMIFYKVYGIREVAEEGLRAIGKEESAGQSPANCVSCGMCEQKCPQKISIMEQLVLVNQEFQDVFKKE